MNKDRKNIIVLEPSIILYEGLLASILKLENNYSFYHIKNLYEVETLIARKSASVVIINPRIVLNKLNEFTKLKAQHPDIYWIGIIYSFYENVVLKLFDDIFSITDDITSVVKKISSANNSNTNNGNGKEYLSTREMEVLEWLANGLSSKEIADQLHLSVHTINTHRKKIMEKTGIRSLAGLTIYAIAKGIIAID